MQSACRTLLRCRELKYSRALYLLGCKLSTVKPCFADTRLTLTPHYYGHFVLSLGKESPYILFKFNPINTNTLL